MPKNTRLFAEGDADEKFFKDFLVHIHGGDSKQIDIVKLGGWANLQKAIPKFLENSDLGGINLVILDADDDTNNRRDEINGLRQKNNIEFDLFLLPDNTSSGEFETLLSQIINPDHKLIFDCFDSYEECLSQSGDYNTPLLKGKIYAYLEALIPHHKSREVKDKYRDYLNKEHWNLNAEELTPLREFLSSPLFNYFSK